MTVHPIRLPVDIEQGAEGGPGFKTSILTLASGGERRNIEWSRVRGEWDISYGIQSKADIDDVKAFFYARRANGYGFLFKDWSDCEIGAVGSAQIIGTGTGALATFQIVKVYEPGTYEYSRLILRPVTGTLLVYVNAVLKTETTHYTVDYTTGIITFTGGNIPANGLTVAVICEFDIPVRFVQEKLVIRVTWEDAMEVPSIPVIELKDNE